MSDTDSNEECASPEEYVEALRFQLDDYQTVIAHRLDSGARINGVSTTISRYIIALRGFCCSRHAHIMTDDDDSSDTSDEFTVDDAGVDDGHATEKGRTFSEGDDSDESDSD